MKKSRSAIWVMLLITIGLIACGAETPPTPARTATAEPAGLLTDPDQATAEAIAVEPTFTPTPSPRPAATNTRLPAATATGMVTATSSPTPEPEPVMKVDETLTTHINVRAGPGTGYPVVGRLEPGQEATVLGRNEDDSWWQIGLTGTEGADTTGWVFGELITLSGHEGNTPIVEGPPPPLPPTPDPNAAGQAEADGDDGDDGDDRSPSAEALAGQLRCGKDFCVTYQAMVPIWENAGCIGNHSIYITVLEGLPPGKPMDGVVVGDTFNNVEVGSGSHGPGRTEITLWNNSMTLYVKRHMDGTPYTSEESFNFTALDELIPAEVLAANGYCDGDVERCRYAHQHNQVCRGHYSWRVTFHKFD